MHSSASANSKSFDLHQHIDSSKGKAKVVHGFNHHYLGHRRRGDVEASHVVIIVLVLLVGAVALGYLKFGPASTAPIPGACGSATPLSTPQTVYYNAGPVSGDGALSSPIVSFFSQQGSYLTQLAGESAGATPSSTTKTNGQYSMQQGIVAQFTATTAYPTTASLNGQNQALTGLYQNGAWTGSQPTVFEQSIQSTTVANICNWLVNAIQIQPPGSGTSATTNVIGNAASVTGLNLKGTGVEATDGVMPTAAQLWNVALNLKQAYKGAMYSIAVTGTQSAPVTNYASGQTTYSGSVNFGGIMIIWANQTNVAVNLDASAPPGMTMVPIPNVASVQAGTLGWVVTIPQGCVPASASASATAQVTCSNVPIDVFQTNSGVDPGSTAITFIFADNQQAAYIQANAVGPAKGSALAQGATTTLTGFTFLTPTSGPDAGAPANYIKQAYTVVLDEA